MISLVSRVISVELPSSSISVNVSVWMCRNNACRTPVPKPEAAFAEKYWAVIEQTRPISPRAISTKHIFTMYGRSLFAIPTSMTAAMTNGTSSSNVASSILKSGASTDSFL